MKKFWISMSFALFVVACQASEDVSMTQPALTVYPNELETKIISLYMDEVLTCTVTFNGTSATISPENTSQETVLFLLSVLAHRIPEYNVDVFYDSTPPE